MFSRTSLKLIEKLYSGKIRAILSHLRFLTRCSARSRIKKVNRLKTIVAFSEDNPFRRPQNKKGMVSWGKALAPLEWSQVKNVEATPEALCSLPSQPQVADLAELPLDELAKLVFEKFRPTASEDPDAPEVVAVPARHMH